MQMDPRMMQQMRQQQMLGMQRPQSPLMPPQQQPPTGMPPMQGMGQGMPQQIDPRTGQMIRPQMLGQGMQQPPPPMPMQQQQQGVESPLPADPMQRLRMELLQDKAAEARNREMLERSIQQKKVRDTLGAQVAPQEQRRKSMFDEMGSMPEGNYQIVHEKRGGPRVGAEEMFRRMR